MRQRAAIVTFVVLLATFGFMLLGASSALPELVATHFGANGAPNGWVEREHFVTVMTIMVVVPVVVIQGVGFLIGYLPPSLINLPNRDYWLGSDRRDETIARVRTAMLEFGNATMAFLLFVVWSIIDANKESGGARLGRGFAFGLLAFLAFVTLWTFFLVRPYLKLPGGEA